MNTTGRQTDRQTDRQTYKGTHKLIHPSKTTHIFHKRMNDDLRLASTKLYSFFHGKKCAILWTISIHKQTNKSIINHSLNSEASANTSVDKCLNLHAFSHIQTQIYWYKIITFSNSNVAWNWNTTAALSFSFNIFFLLFIPLNLILSCFLSFCGIFFLLNFFFKSSSIYIMINNKLHKKLQ